MKTAIVFAGQGAQFPGMGKDLNKEYKSAAKIFNEAGEQIKTWCFESDETVLKQTNVTQPAVYSVSMASYAALVEELIAKNLKKKVEIVSVAGFSLGEYSALTTAGAIQSITDGVKIVSKRGILMNSAGTDIDGNNKGGMVAAIGDRQTIEYIVNFLSDGGIIECVNYNSPNQTVVAGDNESLKKFIKEAKEKKIRTVPLRVSAPFHSKMMEPAAKELRQYLEQFEFSEPKIKTYSDVAAKNIMDTFDGSDISSYLADTMAKQTMSPVRWYEIIERMVQEGVEVIIECGPGDTLSKLTRSMFPDVLTLQAGSVEQIRQTVSIISEI